MIKYYKIGRLMLKIESSGCFQETEKIARFCCDAGESDYEIYVDFTSCLPDTVNSSLYETADRVYLPENGVFCCYYKSRENGAGFYASREMQGNKINIAIDEKYREMLRDDVIFSLVGIEELVVENKGFILHSSYVLWKDSAILFTGPCSIGKSTQAKLWERHADAVVVNGDKTLIENIDGNFFASGLPFSGSSTDCLNVTAPVKAIVCLDKGLNNTVTRIHPPHSFYSIYKNCYPVPFSEKLTGSLIDVVSLAGERIPVFDFICLPDASAVESLMNEILML